MNRLPILSVDLFGRSQQPAHSQRCRALAAIFLSGCGGVILTVGIVLRKETNEVIFTPNYLGAPCYLLSLHI